MESEGLGATDLEKERIYQTIYGRFDAALKTTEKVLYKVLVPGLVPGSSPADVVLPSERGYLPPPEARRMLQNALKEEFIPRPVRYQDRTVDVPTPVPGLVRGIGPAIPLANLVVFLNASTDTYTSEAKRNLVVKRAEALIDLFPKLRVDLAKKEVSNMQIHMYNQIDSLYGRYLRPLLEEVDESLRIRSTSDAELSRLRANIAESFEEASKKTISLPEEGMSHVSYLTRITNKRTEEFRDFTKKTLILPPEALYQRETRYVPPAVIVDIRSNDINYDSLSGTEIV